MTDIEISYKQDIVINDENCVAYIKAIKSHKKEKNDNKNEIDDSYNQLEYNCDNSYQLEYNDKDEKLSEHHFDIEFSVIYGDDVYFRRDNISHKQLKRLQNGLRNKLSLTYAFSIDMNNEITLKITHSCMDTFDE